MASLDVIIRELYSKKKLVKIKPAQLKTHIFDTEEFKKLFGPSYREIVGLLTEDRTFFEMTLIASDLRKRGQMEPIYIDEDGIVIDGGTRASILAALGMDIEAFQLPIKCRESPEKMAICVAIALATVKKKGMGEKFRQLITLLKPGFDKVGIPIAEVLGIDLEAIAQSVPAKIEAEVKVPEEARSAIMQWVEKTIEALSLSPNLKATVEKLMELAPPEEVFRDELNQRIKQAFILKTVAIAKAYLLLALKIAGTGIAQYNAVINYDPLHGKAPKSSVVNRLLARLENYLKRSHGLDRDTMFKILLRTAVERVHEELGLEKRGISKDKLLEATEQVVREYEDVLKIASPLSSIRAGLAITIAIRRLGVKDVVPSRVVQILGAVKGVVYYIRKRLAERKDEKTRKFLEELGLARP